MQEIDVYLEAAARALERAASKTPDSKLRDLLVQKASEIRSLLSSTHTLSTTSVESTIDKLVEEIRRIIQPRVESGPETGPAHDPLKVLLGPLRFFEEMEERLKELDRILSRLLP